MGEKADEERRKIYGKIAWNRKVKENEKERSDTEKGQRERMKREFIERI